MKIKMYTKLEGTPLSFHMFYSTFMLPMTLFLNSFNLISSIFSFFKLKTIDFVDILTTLMTIVVVLLSFFAWRGLPRFKKKGLIFAFSLLSFEVLIAITNLVISFISLKKGETPELDKIALISSVISIGLYLLIFYYYIKRFPLFSKDGVIRENNTPPIEAVPQDIASNEVIVKSEDIEKTDEVEEYDCPRCGFHIKDGAVFCPHCGAQTRSVR